MPPLNSSDSELLKSLLEPLLKDFQFWLGRSHALLNQQRIDFLSEPEQADLLQRVTQGLREVGAAQALFDATQGQIGIESSALLPWHNLVTECWQVACRFHRQKAEENQNLE
jgi:cytochrome c peroxidase